MAPTPQQPALLVPRAHIPLVFCPYNVHRGPMGIMLVSLGFHKRFLRRNPCWTWVGIERISLRQVLHSDISCHGPVRSVWRDDFPTTEGNAIERRLGPHWAFAVFRSQVSELA
jgi:hypothetical protein